MDKTEIIIDCDSGELTVINPLQYYERSMGKVAQKTYKSQLVADLILPELSRLMNMSKNELMEKHLQHLSHLGFSKEQLKSGASPEAVPIIHWSKNWNENWNEIAECGQSCDPKYTSSGTSINCPECRQLFKEQNPPRRP